jgi:hypothetical protein
MICQKCNGSELPMVVVERGTVRCPWCDMGFVPPAKRKSRDRGVVYSCECPDDQQVPMIGWDDTIYCHTCCGKIEEAV